jgi:hypothetical protein
MSGHDDGQDARVAFSLQELVYGITTGALYTLVALSFTMVYEVLKLLKLRADTGRWCVIFHMLTSLDPLAWSLRKFGAAWVV